jgi:hypothetical protein
MLRKQTQFKPNLSRRSLWRSRNKPNYEKAEMNVNKVLTTEYENKRLRRRAENKPKKLASAKKQMRQVGDIMRRVNGFAFLTCACGLKMKIPPNFKSNKVACPRCKKKQDVRPAGSKLRTYYSPFALGFQHFFKLRIYSYTAPLSPAHRAVIGRW